MGGCSRLSSNFVSRKRRMKRRMAISKWKSARSATNLALTQISIFTTSLMMTGAFTTCKCRSSTEMKSSCRIGKTPARKQSTQITR